MILELKNINFGFNKDKPLLKSLSMSLEQGKIYALMGDNGSGKTTLLNLISGFLKPQNGQISVHGKPLIRLSPFKINKAGIGRTFQDLRLISQLTVKENILLAIQGNPTDSWYKGILPASFFLKDLSRYEKTVETILTDFFLSEIKNSLAGEISYGQQKLLNLACSVANGAEILLLDEPVAGINKVYKEQISEKLQLLKQQGKTILIVEHDTDFIKQTAEQFLMLSEGTLQSYDTWQEAIFEPEIKLSVRPPKLTKGQPEVLLKIENLNAGYCKKQVLFDVSLEVNSGELVLLTGGNGSGKSTLLKSIYGLLTDSSFKKGKLTFAGKSIASATSYSLIREGLVYVPQKNNTFDNLTVKETLEVAANILPNAIKKDRIEEVFGYLPQLAALESRTPFNMSGGEKQTLALGMALLHKPKMILLDEPGTGLSAVNFFKKLELLASLNEVGITFLIVEHRVREFDGRIDKLIKMHLGQIEQKP
jgi:branched-chain amino acid transport system ATP-binding protein